MRDNPPFAIIKHAWRHKNALFYLVLLPVSWLFSALVWLRRSLYQIGIFKSYRLPVPLIVVGNIHAGGSGKTPVAIYLINQLKQKGYKPGLISRGYGGSARKPTAVYANSSAALVGDEPLLVAQRTGAPVWVAAKRVDAAKALLQAHPECDVLISDDGLQHYKLKRDVEIAVIDTDAPHALSPYLLPAGPLREPLVRLNSVDIIISHGEKQLQNSHAMHLRGDIFYNLQNPQQHAKATDFKHKAIKAMAGIGRPQRFFDHLNSLGLSFATVSFDDHHPYTREDLSAIDADVLLMTEKDAVKCAPYAQAHHWVLPVEAQMDGAVLEKIVAKIARK